MELINTKDLYENDAVGMINTDDQKQDNWTKLSQSDLCGVLLSTWHVSDFQTV